MTGTRIGGGSDILSIGGAENTCIKDPVTHQPYLPGSSLKGKLRSVLEIELGNASLTNGKPCGCAKEGCLICRLFGPHMNLKHSLGPGRLLMRDAHLIDGGAIEFKESTSIDRLKGSAQGGTLRSEERVNAGSTFGFELVVTVMESDLGCEYEDYDGNVGKGGDAFFNLIEHGCSLMQLAGIGAGVSRGNGQIQFTHFNREPITRSKLRAGA